MFTQMALCVANFPLRNYNEQNGNKLEIPGLSRMTIVPVRLGIPQVQTPVLKRVPNMLNTARKFLRKPWLLLIQ